METITVYKDSYYGEMDRSFELQMKLAKLQGNIKALAEMDDSPEFVFGQLKKLVEEMEEK